MSSRSVDFQFELNGTLYFDRGDEVLELIGISLNPEITIHPYEAYVSIRGEIELRGEYMRDEATEEVENDYYSFEEIEAKRYVKLVDSKEDNMAEFYHSFPVDISVPVYRIDNMDDLRVEVVEFDYEFPDNSKIQLTAKAEIQGIKAEANLSDHEETRASKEEIIPDETLKPFAFELKREETEFEEGETVENERGNEEEENEVEIIEMVESEESRLGITAEEEEEAEQEESKGNELTIRAMEQQEEEGGEGTEQAEDVVNDVSYLTDIFRDEEEESYTRMKICIVQEDDTIETIAERFQISALQLIKQNKLDENFDVSEGQLLYIPKK